MQAKYKMKAKNKDKYIEFLELRIKHYEEEERMKENKKELDELIKKSDETYKELQKLL